MSRAITAEVDLPYRLDHSGFTGIGGAFLAFVHRGWRKIVRRRLAGHLRTTVN